MVLLKKERKEKIKKRVRSRVVKEVLAWRRRKIKTDMLNTKSTSVCGDLPVHEASRLTVLHDDSYYNQQVTSSIPETHSRGYSTPYSPPSNEFAAVYLSHSRAATQWLAAM